MYALEEKKLQEILNYLVNCPYKDVFNLIEYIKNAQKIKPNE